MAAIADVDLLSTLHYILQPDNTTVISSVGSLTSPAEPNY